MTEDQKAKLNRVLINAGIMAVAAGATTFLQQVQQADFGNYSQLVMLAIGVLIKAVQSFLQPAQEVYK